MIKNSKMMACKPIKLLSKVARVKVSLQIMCLKGTVCSLGHRLKDRDQTGVTGTFPTQCHLDGEVLSV
jgi:hypothetical protein